MSDCSKHKVPEYLNNLEQVANDIGDMPYDKVSEFFGYLQIKIQKDSENDGKGGRHRLSILLGRAAFNISTIRDQFIKIWELCKPYMK
jgi:hypothetical protein